MLADYLWPAFQRRHAGIVSPKDRPPRKEQDKCQRPGGHLRNTRQRPAEKKCRYFKHIRHRWRQGGRIEDRSAATDQTRYPTSSEPHLWGMPHLACGNIGSVCRADALPWQRLWERHPTGISDRNKRGRKRITTRPGIGPRGQSWYDRGVSQLSDRKSFLRPNLTP